MTIRCPTCGGSGKVAVSLPPGTYSIHPWPTEVCRTCGGSGWYDEAAKLDTAFRDLMTYEPQPDEPTDADIEPRLRYRFPK